MPPRPVPKRQKMPPRPVPKRQKIQREEEQGNSQLAPEQLSPPSPPQQEPERAPSPPDQEPESAPSPSYQEPKRAPSPPYQEPERTPSPPLLPYKEPERAPSPPYQEPERTPSPPLLPYQEPERAPLLPSYQEPERAPSPPLLPYQEPERAPSPPLLPYQEPERAPLLPSYQEPERAPSPSLLPYQEPERAPSPPYQEPERTPSPTLLPYQEPERAPLLPSYQEPERAPSPLLLQYQETEQAPSTPYQEPEWVLPPYQDPEWVPLLPYQEPERAPSSDQVRESIQREEEQGISQPPPPPGGQGSVFAVAEAGDAENPAGGGARELEADAGGAVAGAHAGAALAGPGDVARARAGAPLAVGPGDVAGVRAGASLSAGQGDGGARAGAALAAGAGDGACAAVGGAFTLAPFYRDPDPEALEYFDDMAEFYLEAARRLPIAQMPKLAGFLSLNGLLVGLNQPVINIIVNAMYIMAKFGASDVLPQGTDPVRHAAERASYVRIARKSRAALVVFMTFYFRHLTRAQAKCYLRAARHDLVLAIGLVELHRKGLVSQGHTELLSELFHDLLPDCARTKTALRYAAPAAMVLHDPDDLMQLVASRFHCQMLDPVLNDLSTGEQLTVSRVNYILNLLQEPYLRKPPLPAPIPGTFRDANGNVTIIIKVGQDLFSTTTIPRDGVTAFNNGEGNEKGKLVATTTILRHPSDHADDGLCDTGHLTTDPHKEIRFCSFMRTSTAAQQLRPDMNSLMMCLLDTIHGFYIEALTRLPIGHQPRLLHAILSAGYCYGVMYHPVHNIIVNSIFYSLHYPPPEDDEIVQIQYTRSIKRVASCSLSALIAVAHRTILPMIHKEEEAVLYLSSHNCSILMEYRQLVVAANASNYPHPMDLVAFMELLLPLRNRLNHLLVSKHALSSADIKMITNWITMPTCNLCQFALTDPDCRVQAYVRKKLEELLFNYGLKDPLGPQYKLVIICGVASKICSSYHRGITCYHANFLARTGDVPASSAGDILFFAEFWNQADDDCEQSKMPPICWPVTHRTYHCRCFICESAAIRIVHPLDVNYFMGHQVSTDSLCAVAEHEAALGELILDF